MRIADVRVDPVLEAGQDLVLDPEVGLAVALEAVLGQGRGPEVNQRAGHDPSLVLNRDPVHQSNYF